MRLDDACDILGVVRVHDPHTRLPRIQGTRDEAQKLYRKLARSVLTRTSRSLRAVRMGYAYQPPACCTYRRRRAARPEAQRTARVPASAYRTYRVPWHHRRCCTIRTAGARTPCLAQHARTPAGAAAHTSRLLAPPIHRLLAPSFPTARLLAPVVAARTRARRPSFRASVRPGSGCRSSTIRASASRRRSPRTRARHRPRLAVPPAGVTTSTVGGAAAI